jgi:hypothetical protein
MALTLTSDIKLDEYQELLKQAASVPKLPTSIQSLTLELFSMGYPPGFLTSLIEALPHIKTLVLYSQLLAGITPESEADAVRFFEKASDLRAVHLLDVFSKTSFFEGVAPVLRQKEKGLMFLEVSYSYRHEEQFLSSIPAAALPGLVTPSLVSLSLNMSSADVTDDPDDPTNLEEEGGKGEGDGIVALGDWAEEFVDALVVEEKAPRSLRGLNGTLYSLSLEQLKTVLEKHRGLVVVSTTIETDGSGDFKKELREILGGCQNLEQVEIIVNPTGEFPKSVSYFHFGYASALMLYSSSMTKRRHWSPCIPQNKTWIACSRSARS